MEPRLYEEKEPKCRKCGSLDTRPYGKTVSAKFGIKKRYACNKCGATFGAGNWLGKHFSEEIVKFALYQSRKHLTGTTVSKMIQEKYGIPVAPVTIRKWAIRYLNQKRKSGKYSNYARISFAISSQWKGRHKDLSRLAGVPVQSVYTFFRLFEEGAVLAIPERKKPIIERHLLNIEALLGTVGNELVRVQADIRRAHPNSHVGAMLRE